MDQLIQSFENNIWQIELSGRVDSSNAQAIEAEISKGSPSEQSIEQVIVDMTKLEYISSAGLRILLRLRKKFPSIHLTNASSAVYEILEMTGFTEMMSVSKAFRTLSVEGCDVIGKGSNGIVYRYDPETIVKVYYRKDALQDIQHEREVARKALILGIPTALSYDVVKVDDSYGSVFELLDADTLSSKIKNHPDDLSEAVSIYTDMLKTIHGIEAEQDEFPSAKETAIKWAEYLESYLPESTYNKLLGLISAIPEDRHLIHGDYHTNNLMIQNGETLLIDMDTLSQGHPVLEFGTMFLANKGFYELSPHTCEDFLGYSVETANNFWRETLAAYLDTDDENIIQEFEDQSSVIGYTRMMRRTIKRIGVDTPEGAALTEHCRARLIELCDHLDSLI